MITKDQDLVGSVIKLFFTECNEQFPLMLCTVGEKQWAIFVRSLGSDWEYADIPNILCGQQHLFDQVAADLHEHGYTLHRPPLKTLH